MAWEIEFADEFGTRWNSLAEDEQESVSASVILLEKVGPVLSRPHVDTLKGSRFPNMKELRVQHDGRPLHIFFAFDPRRMAYLISVATKRAITAFYERMIPVADQIYADHL